MSHSPHTNSDDESNFSFGLDFFLPAGLITEELSDEEFEDTTNKRPKKSRVLHEPPQPNSHSPTYDQSNWAESGYGLENPFSQPGSPSWSLNLYSWPHYQRPSQPWVFS
jgi:hypothetical protein